MQFLQWALPQLRMRWTGFRKVRGQVCKRLQRRIRRLGLEGEKEYRRYLAEHPGEWQTLDVLTRVTISRFYRDKRMFDCLADEVLPALARQALARGADCLRVWSAGAGAGEEPYTVAMIWRLRLMKPGAALVIGVHERPPDGVTAFTAWSDRLRIYRLEEGSH